MVSNFNHNKIRENFPIFNNNPNLIYFDNAATTQKPKLVLDEISNYYQKINANIHRGIYQIAEKSTEKYEHTRDKIAAFIGSKHRQSIIFTSGTTESINLVANSWGENLRAGDEVLISEMEHHSNIIPWQLICNKKGAKLKYIPILNNGTLDLSNAEKLFTNKTKIVSIIHQSNVFGTINPVKKIIKMAHDVGALVMLDGAQSIPHSIIDVSDLNCDFFVFSGHKMVGPTGIGVLYGKPEILDKMQPFLGGGEMIKNVSMNKSSWNELPWKFEAGTPKIAQVIGLGSAIDYLINIGINNINKYVNELKDYAEIKLKNIPGITIYGESKNKGPVLSFNLENIHPHDVAQILDTYGIAIRAGHHCAQPIMKHLNISATNRASFYFYNTKKEIDKLILHLGDTINLFS